TAVAEAAPSLQRYTPGRSSGNVMLFDDGDYVFFLGVVQHDGGRSTVKVSAILAQKLSESSPRSRLYGKLVPSNAINITSTGLASVPGTEPAWQEDLRRGEEFDFITYGP